MPLGFLASGRPWRFDRGFGLESKRTIELWPDPQLDSAGKKGRSRRSRLVTSSSTANENQDKPPLLPKVFLAIPARITSLPLSQGSVSTSSGSRLFDELINKKFYAEELLIKIPLLRWARSQADL